MFSIDSTNWKLATQSENFRLPLVELGVPYRVDFSTTGLSYKIEFDQILLTGTRVDFLTETRKSLIVTKKRIINGKSFFIIKPKRSGPQRGGFEDHDDQMCTSIDFGKIESVFIVFENKSSTKNLTITNYQYNQSCGDAIFEVFGSR
jgi:hypothetical protein